MVAVCQPSFMTHIVHCEEIENQTCGGGFRSSYASFSNPQSGITWSRLTETCSSRPSDLISTRKMAPLLVLCTSSTRRILHRGLLSHIKPSLLCVNIFPDEAVLHLGWVNLADEVCWARNSPRVVLDRYRCFNPKVIVRFGMHGAILFEPYFSGTVTGSTYLQMLSQFLSNHLSLRW